MDKVSGKDLLYFYVAKWGFSHKLDVTYEHQVAAYKHDQSYAYRSLLDVNYAEYEDFSVDDHNREVFELLKNKTITQVRRLIAEKHDDIIL